jgi:MGT family glycosyltransferase
MAKAVFFNLPFFGHVNPTLSLIAELTRRGEDITYYSAEAFRAVIERAGATFRGIDSFINERTRVEENPLTFAYTLMRTTQDILPILLDETRANPPDYIIHDSLCVWGRCIAEITGIPAVGSCAALARPQAPLHPDVLAGMLFMLPRFIPMALEGYPDLRRFAAVSKHLGKEYGFPRVRLADAYNNLSDLNIVYSIRELQIWPDAFDERFVFAGPSLNSRELPGFPFEELGSKPVIYISLGTLYNSRPDFYRLCFDAFADFDSCVVMAIGRNTDPAHMGPIPPNFIVRSYVPQLQILPRTALFITHGGMNSMNEGLAADVPLVLIPQASDQFLNAHRAQQLGAGKVLDRRHVTAGQLRAAAEETLTNPTYRERAAKLGAALRATGGAVTAADAIEAFKRKHGL